MRGRRARPQKGRCHQVVLLATVVQVPGPLCVSMCLVLGRQEELVSFGVMHEESSHYQLVSHQRTFQSKELAFQEPLIRFEVQGGQKKKRLFAEYIITFISARNTIFAPVK